MRAARFGETCAIAGLLGLSALPFVALFPDPPAFGQQAILLFATFGVVAVSATAWRAAPTGRWRILRRAGLVFAVSAATTVSNMVLHGGIPLVPTLDILPALFDLQGEDTIDAILFEAWVEQWLAWAALIWAALIWAASAGLLVGVRRHVRPAPPLTAPAPTPLRWNAATILLWLVGWCAMVGTVLEGHRVAAFLKRADHADGVIANDDAHPLIRFTTAGGQVVVFRQNGGISRAVGATVPVAYDAADPQNTAEANTLFSIWGNTEGLAWLGLGFTLFPFFGARAAFGRR